MGIEGTGHPPEFWSAFKYILMISRDSGVFASLNYGEMSTRYCGIDINYNPLYDANVPIP